MNTNNQTIYIGGAVVFKKEKDGKTCWFLIKNQEEQAWEMPKVVARKGESSVRAVLRMLGEQAGMGCRVIEEVGRINDSTAVNGKIIPRRVIYYLVIQKSQSEALGFEEDTWLEYSKAVKKVKAKKEQSVLREAQKVLRDWRKEVKRRKQGLR